MRPMARAALLLAIPLLVAACSHAPNPIIARDPLPPPPPGYRVACDTYEAPFYLYHGHCRPVAPPAPAVVRARG